MPTVDLDALPIERVPAAIRAACFESNARSDWHAAGMALIHANLSERDAAARRLFGLPARAVPKEQLDAAIASELE